MPDPTWESTCAVRPSLCGVGVEGRDQPHISQIQEHTSNPGSGFASQLPSLLRPMK